MKNSTGVVGAFVLILATLGAVLYLTETDRPTDVALGLMVPILTTVVGVVFVAGKVDTVKSDTEQTINQTNGTLDARIQKAIQDALAIHDGKGTSNVGDGTVHGPENGGPGDVGNL